MRPDKLGYYEYAYDTKTLSQERTDKLLGYGFIHVDGTTFLAYGYVINFETIDPEKYLEYAFTQVFEAGKRAKMNEIKLVLELN